MSLKGLKHIQLKAILPKHSLIKSCVELNSAAFKSLNEVEGVVTQGGMKLFRLQVGGGSSLIFGTYGDRDGTVCFVSFHILYVDLLM